MEGVIKRFQDEYTVVVQYSENGIEKSQVMRIVGFKGSHIKEGDRVRFDMAEKDAYRRIICRVIDRR